MELAGQKRKETGKKVKNIRAEGNIPAVIFGKGMESENVVIERLAFEKVFNEVGETNLIDLKINGDVYKVLINEIQYDPISDQVIHASLYKPDLTHTVDVNVPVEVIGEENNALVKSGEGVAIVLLQEIPIRALPTELKDAFIIDVSNLTEIGAGVTIGELDYDKEKVEIMDLDETETVVRLDSAVMAEEPEEEEGPTEEELIEGMEATAEAEEAEESSEE